MKALDPDLMEAGDHVSNDSPEVSNKGGKNIGPVCYRFDVSEHLVGPVASKVKYQEGFVNLSH